MIRIKTLCLIVIIGLLALTLTPVIASQGLEHITVILLVDNSGSMKTSDPGGLRFTGARLFASLLDPGDALGLILFSTESNVMTNGVVTLESQNAGGRSLENFQPPAADGYTDIKAALDDAKELLRQANLSGGKVVIVLLTDGKPEILTPYPEYEQETLDLARSLNSPIIAMALTSAAQTPFLDRLASATNGSVILANNASDILSAYLQILGQVKDRTVIGGDSFTDQFSLQIEPALAPYVHSATFIVAKSGGVSIQLFDPGGNLVAEGQTADTRFSLFTLENPAGGSYTFRLQGGGEAQAWTILRSRLRIQFVEPGNFHPMGMDMPIISSLLEETPDGNSIAINGEVNFTALVTWPDGRQTSLDRFYDDGTHGDMVAGDGNYSRLLPSPNLEGVYHIFVQGWKGAIPVQAETRINVLKFPEFVLDAPIEEVEVRGNPIALRVHLDNGSSFEEGDVVAHITSPSGLMDEVVLQFKTGGYEGQFLPAEDGTYHVLFATRGVKHLGLDYQAQIEKNFIVELFPTATVKLEEVHVASACFSSSNDYSFLLSVTAADENYLRFTVPGWQVIPKEVRIHPGEQEFSLRLYPLRGESESIERVKMQIEGIDRLEIQPEAVIGVDVEIPSLYARCRTPIHLGVVTLLIVVVGVAFLQHARKAALPPSVTGTLRHWAIGKDMTSAMEIDLTSFRKHALSIGSGATCDVMIPHADLASEHARVIAEKSADDVVVTLEPMDEVQKGYSHQNLRFVLRHGETFRMGTHEFQYLSDHGE